MQRYLAFGRCSIQAYGPGERLDRLLSYGLPFLSRELEETPLVCPYLGLIEGQSTALMPQGGPLSLQVPLHTPQPSSVTEIGSYPFQPHRTGTGLTATLLSRAMSLNWAGLRGI